MIPYITIVKQYERLAVFWLGKFSGLRPPGLKVMFWPFVTYQRIDLREAVIDIPRQTNITRDNAPHRHRLPGLHARHGVRRGQGDHGGRRLPQRGNRHCHHHAPSGNRRDPARRRALPARPHQRVAAPEAGRGPPSAGASRSHRWRFARWSRPATSRTR